MALFNNDGKSKEEKKEEKIAAKLEKFGLNDLSDPDSREMTKKILDSLVGTFAMETGMTLTIGKNPEDLLPVYYQRALMEQNWIIIKQLDQISLLMKGILSKMV